MNNEVTKPEVPKLKYSYKWKKRKHFITNTDSRVESNNDKDPELVVAQLQLDQHLIGSLVLIKLEF